MRRIFQTLFVALSLLLFSLTRLHATQVLPVNMSDILSRADVAFIGTCVGVEVGEVSSSPGSGKLPVTTYVFSVAKDGVIKGNIPEKFRLTQFGISKSESLKRMLPYTIGMPSYEIGKEYTLFLTPESSLGLRSTIGLGQGKFNIFTGKDGKKQVINDHGNKGLFNNMPQTKGVTKAMGAAKLSVMAPPPEGALELNSFVNLLQELKKGE